MAPYTDFIDNIGPIVSELNEFNIECVAYHGEMDLKSRNESYFKWRSGEIKVMVASYQCLRNGHRQA